MKVILLQDVKSLGKKGELVEVSEGYGRNFLLPRNVAKEANAQATRLQSRTTSLAAEYARQGKDWETELQQIAKEQILMKQLGIAPEEAQPKNGKDEDED